METGLGSKEKISLYPDMFKTTLFVGLVVVLLLNALPVYS